MQTNVTPNAIGYIRVSTGLQAEEGFGLDVQEQQIRRLCEERGFHLITVFSDEGISGAKDVEGRPGLAAALNALETAASVLVVAKLDRLARALTIQEAVLAQAWKFGATVFTADLGEVQKDDPDDPMRTAMRQMVGVFSQLERAMIAARLRSGRRLKAAQGGYAGYGSPQFGMRAEGRQLIPDLGEQATVARIRELRESGTGLRAIAQTLNDEGRPSKRGGPWHTETVRRVLQRADERREAEMAAKVRALHTESLRQEAAERRGLAETA